MLFVACYVVVKCRSYPKSLPGCVNGLVENYLFQMASYSIHLERNIILYEFKDKFNHSYFICLFSIYLKKIPNFEQSKHHTYVQYNKEKNWMQNFNLYLFCTQKVFGYLHIFLFWILNLLTCMTKQTLTNQTIYIYIYFVATAM